MKNKSLLALLAIPLAGLGIVGSVAFAQSNVPTSQPTQTETVNQREVDSDTEIPDAQEQQMLQAKATITADQAKQVAETKLGGTATSIQLEDEDGTVVYNVVIGDQEVKVNAADGTITKIESADTENDSDDTKQMTTGHGNEPNDGASVSDGDGETNDDGIIQ
ncbi:hypothetical protein A2419_02600 [Candidatus Adlerbacteria bacterium RIFOXYC1_FULL_48_26]|uniref:PepSY domain-containing protein n=1 Tax=Candidatus Adlerbacteria bacterium RIFOXYC1_FULL_48_26 TaxID=1797247 RepID=A0A1F4Y6J4_9BACT|nr:MAG: hypothetical protein A2419_02600 [Candidatus Adlerbacteria bacterium RIFOXYC1_FULL_48_26]